MSRYKAQKGHGRPHVGVRVDKQDKEILKAIAARKGISISDLLRQTIDQVINEYLRNPQ